MPTRDDVVQVLARSRDRVGTSESFTLTRTLHFHTLAVVICDMWNAVHCLSATQRVAEMAPHMNGVIDTLRARGAFIIHAPSDCMNFYADTPQRERARSARQAEAPVAFGWNERNPAREPPLPETLADDTECSCDTPEPCCEGGPPYPWTRQVEALTLAPQDAVTDDGQEVYNLLQQHGIQDVILMGVHANRCVLGRSFGIRQLIYVGKRPLLCRDLTDSFHRDGRGHQWGTQATIAHIERFWCPTVTSNQLVGGTPFVFDERRAPTHEDEETGSGRGL